MLKKKAFKIALFALFAASTTAFAQDGASVAHSPYSVFGVGDVLFQGSAYNKAMGGTGIAARNRKVVNIQNPASVTSRDSLSFMTDFSLKQSNKLYRQGDIKSANNSCNLNDIVISFPIYRSSAMMVGIVPYSGLGYEFSSYEQDKELVGVLGNINKSSLGTGGLYKLFVSGGVTFWKKLSLGVEYQYYFGNLSKANGFTFTSTGYNGLSSGYDMVLKSHSAKLGLQFEQSIGNKTLGVGATYDFSARLKGTVVDYKISSSTLVSDTLRYSVNDLSKDKVSLAGELGVGVSLKSGEKWRAEIDYVTSDWTKTGMDKVDGFANVSNAVFSATRSQSVRGGFELVPNVNDVRYYLRKVSYKAGAYYNKELYMLDGKSVNSVGLTLGMSFPIYKYYNALSVCVDFGQRGSLTENLVRERFINFTIGLNAFDIWFQKTRYN